MPSINMKDAVITAKATIQDLYQGDPLKGLALEEIELRDQRGRNVWAVTFGFHRPKSVSVAEPNLHHFLGHSSQVENRVYKTMLIDANTGEFVKMDMRLV